MHGILISLILILGSTAITPPKRAKAKPRKKPHAATVAAKPKAVAPRPPIIGASVEVITKDGKQLSGQVAELSALSVKLKSDSGESVLTFDSIASISFGPTPAAENRPLAAAGHPNFTREVESVLTAFGEMEKAIGSTPDYTEYGRQLSELRRSTERFILKYGSSDDAVEAHSAGLLAAALTDYTWARTVWTLKLGRSIATNVSPGDSPVVADALDLYPEMRPQSPAAASVPANKIIDALWKKAVQQTEQTRKLISQ